MKAQVRQLAAGLMTVAMSLPLIADPNVYTRQDAANAIGLTVVGAPGSDAGLTVAIPVSGDSDKPAAKPARRAPLRQKRSNS